MTNSSLIPLCTHAWISHVRVWFYDKKFCGCYNLKVIFLILLFLFVISFLSFCACLCRPPLFHLSVVYSPFSIFFCLYLSFFIFLVIRCFPTILSTQNVYPFLTPRLIRSLSRSVSHSVCLFVCLSFLLNLPLLINILLHNWDATYSLTKTIFFLF